jgi:hypothetical protein
MKLGGRNLFLSIAVMVMLLINHVSVAQYSDADSSPHGIPYGSWSTSRDETSSRSSRNNPGSPGEWSEMFNPASENGLFGDGNPYTKDVIKSASVAMESEHVEAGYGGHGIPSSTWANSRDETGSISNRLSPGGDGQRSPKAKTSSYANSQVTRNLQEVSTSSYSYSSSGSTDQSDQSGFSSSSDSGSSGAAPNAGSSQIASTQNDAKVTPVKAAPSLKRYTPPAADAAAAAPAAKDVASPTPQRVSAPTPQHVSATAAHHVSAPAAHHVAAPYPQHVSAQAAHHVSAPAPYPQRFPAPAAHHVSAPAAHHVAAPYPQRFSAPAPRVAPSHISRAPIVEEFHASPV